LSTTAVDLPTRSEEESRVAANWLQRMAQALAPGERPVFRSALAEAGISDADLRSASNISLPQLDRVQEQLRAAIPGITLRAYRHSTLLDLGLTGYAMTSSGTVRRALEIAVQYNELTTDRYALDFRVEGQQAIIRQLPAFGHLHEQVDIAEELSGLWQIVRQLVGDQGDPGDAAVCFEYPAPGYAELYEEAFDCPCRFEAERTELRFPAAWLDFPVAGADEVTAQLCQSMCERLLGKAGSRRSLTDAVQRMLISRPDRRIPGLEEAAGLFHMSVNQFRKRLYREDTTYKQLVLDLRMSLARYYLDTTALSVQEIAYMLDYSQPAPFSRAFSAYYGYPPSSEKRRAGGATGQAAPGPWSDL
jgi:AraC-like DNA-binding protein